MPSLAPVEKSSIKATEVGLVTNPICVHSGNCESWREMLKYPRCRKTGWATSILSHPTSVGTYQPQPAPSRNESSLYLTFLLHVVNCNPPLCGFLHVQLHRFQSLRRAKCMTRKSNREE